MWVRIPLSAPISSMRTKKPNTSQGCTHPDSAGVYQHNLNNVLRIVLVEETVAAGRLCKETRMGGSSHCGLMPWAGYWQKLTLDEVKKYIKRTLSSSFGLDTYGYGFTEDGVVVYHYNRVTKQSKSKFPESMYGIPIQHEFMGTITPL